MDFVFMDGRFVFLTGLTGWFGLNCFIEFVSHEGKVEFNRRKQRGRRRNFFVLFIFFVSFC